MHRSDFVLLSLLTLVGCGCDQAESPQAPGNLAAPRTELLYETPDVGLIPDTEGCLKEGVAILNRRFTGHLAEIVHVDLASPQQIRVRIASTDPATIREVECRIEEPGMIEFRVVANKHDHASIIQEARDSEYRRVLNEDGRMISEWITVAADAEDRIRAHPDVVSRERAIGDAKILEALVIHDAYNLNGSYLERAEVRVDEQERPYLVLHWNQAGTELSARLTGENLPDRERGITRNLGIIVDWRLFGACPIHTKLTDTMRVTGSFERQALDVFAAVLNSGTLAVRLKQVAKQTTGGDDAVE